MIEAASSYKFWCCGLLHIFVGYQMKDKHVWTSAMHCLRSTLRIYRLSLPSTGLQNYITGFITGQICYALVIPKEVSHYMIQHILTSSSTLMSSFQSVIFAVWTAPWIILLRVVLLKNVSTQGYFWTGLFWCLSLWMKSFCNGSNSEHQE